jgi:outer membrane receptor protein involved in Fe transport
MCIFADVAVAAASELNKSGKVEEVIVTAQRRAERLQDVPISMSVLEGEKLDASTASGITEILRTVPGVITTVSAQNGGTSINIRGVGAASALYQGTSPISYYLDQVPFSLIRSAVVPDASPYDLDRVEVLRGPQGTLYGSNAQNGVVRILTANPDLDAFDWKARASLSGTEGGGDNSRFDAAVNVPLISDRLAVRAVFGYQNLSGWIDQPDRRNANDAESFTGRFKVRAQLTDRLLVDLSAWLSRSDYGAPSYSTDNETSPFQHEPMTTDYDIFAVNVAYDFSGFTFASSSSYIDYGATGFLDFDPPFAGHELETIDASRIFTQEVYLTSTDDGPWRWSLGAMYRRGDAPEFQDFGQFTGPPASPTPLVPLNFTYESTSHAVFGELTRALFDDRLELTVGARYFQDTVEQKELLNFDGVGPLVESSDEFDAVSPRFVVTWYVNDDLTTYASYSEGFRSGSQQGLLVTQTYTDFPEVRSDNLTNYEAGAKGALFGGRIDFDAAVFFIDWQDVQQPLRVPFASTYITATVNGESASGWGAEFGLSTHLTDAFTLGVNASWNDLTNDEDVFTRSAAFPNGVVLFPEGSRLVNSPKYTIGVFADYGWSLGGGYEARVSASGNYASELSSRSLTGTTSVERLSEPYIFGRASFAIDAPENWTVSLFVDNIDNYYEAYPGGGDRPVRPRPRTWGVQFEYRL